MKNETINVVLYVFIQAFIVGIYMVSVAFSETYRYGFYVFISSFFASTLGSTVIFLFVFLIRIFLRRVRNKIISKRFLEKMVERLKRYEIMNVVLYIIIQAFIVGTFMFLAALEDYRFRDWDVDMLHHAMVFASWFIASFLAGIIVLFCVLAIRAIFKRIPPKADT